MFQRMLRAFTPPAHHPVGILPVVACVPGADVWFLRFTFAFLSHLRQGGHVVDRLTGETVGDPAGPPFNFDHVSGGPLLWAPDLGPSRHLFIGHTICPGFNRISSEYGWWAGTPFSAPGYDYFHDAMNYAHVPVDLAPHAFVPVSVGDVDAAAWNDARQRMVLVYGDPIEKALPSFNLRQSQVRPVYGRSGERPAADRSFDEYLFKHSLPAYAKMMVSYQAMARSVPGAVQIVSEDALRAEPVRILSSVLGHLNLDRWKSPLIDAVVNLARREHIVAIERELGRSLMGSRRSRKIAASSVSEPVVRAARDPGLRRKALTLLASMGVNPTYFEVPPVAVPLEAGAATRRSVYSA